MCILYPSPFFYEQPYVHLGLPEFDLTPSAEMTATDQIAVRILLIPLTRKQPWPFRRTRPRRVSSYLPSTLRHHSSRSYDTCSGTTPSSPPYCASTRRLASSRIHLPKQP